MKQQIKIHEYNTNILKIALSVPVTSRYALCICCNIGNYSSREFCLVFSASGVAMKTYNHKK